MLFGIISSSLVHQYHLVQHDDKDVRTWDQLRIRLLEAVSDLLGGNLLNAEMCTQNVLTAESFKISLKKAYAKCIFVFKTFLRYCTTRDLMERF